ncbi:MAG: 50S ribosomal protein L9 [Bacteroidota bacterium]
MEVILKQDVQKLGYSDDVVKVKNGYGRNYLIPQGMAILATETNKKVLTENLKQRAFKAEKIKKEAEIIAAKLNGIVVKIGAKVSSTGKIFGSVTNIQLAEAIKEQFNHEVDRKKIIFKNDHVKEVGIYDATIRIHKEIEASFQFEVVGE